MSNYILSFMLIRAYHLYNEVDLIIPGFVILISSIDLTSRTFFSLAKSRFSSNQSTAFTFDDFRHCLQNDVDKS